MTIQQITLKLKIDGFDEKTIPFEDSKEVTTACDIEAYRDKIERAFEKKYRQENPGKSINCEVLFTIKN